MNKLLLTIAIAVTLCAAVSAQTPSSPVTIYAGGGLPMPMAPEDFKFGWKTGFNGMLGVGHSFSPAFQIVGKGEYHMFPLDVEGVEGGDVSVLLFGFDGRFAIGIPAAPVKPFIFAGIGLAKVSFSEAKSTTTTVRFPEGTDSYFNAGAGVEFKAGPSMSFFAQASYVDIIADPFAIGFIPITVGVKFF